ncbi:MAG: hypothetical protein PHQ23_15075 [Candidatus Wallbacteria bacterium]|nr:hypothetical protein [Candidatus Wallbacteria bacterium]
MKLAMLVTLASLTALLQAGSGAEAVFQTSVTVLPSVSLSLPTVNAADTTESSVGSSTVNRETDVRALHVEGSTVNIITVEFENTDTASFAPAGNGRDHPLLQQIVASGPGNNMFPDLSLPSSGSGTRRVIISLN